MVSSNNTSGSSSCIGGGGGIVRGVSIKSSDRLRGSLAGVVETEADGDCEGERESTAVFIRSSKKGQNYDPSGVDDVGDVGGHVEEEGEREKGIVIADDSNKGHNYDDLYEVDADAEHDPDATADVHNSIYGGQNYDGWRDRRQW